MITKISLYILSNAKEETYSKCVFLLSKQCTLSLSHIIAPISLIPFVSLLVHNLSITMLLTLLEVTFIHSPISLRLLSLSSDFSIIELTLISGTIAHQQNTLATLNSIAVVSLVLEEWVVISVNTLTFSEFRHGVQVANVTLIIKTVRLAKYYIRLLR